MDKRGSVRDVMLVIVGLFVMAFSVFVMHFTINTSVDSMINVPIINDSNSTAESLRSTQATSERFDYMVFAVFIGMVIALMITGWIVGGHPIFMFIYFIVVMIGVAISTVFSNVWETISQASVFGTTISSFPLTNHLLSYLPVYSAVIGVLGLIVMFAKPYSQGDAP